MVLVYWGQIREDEPQFGQIMSLLNLTFEQLFMWFGANNDQI